MRYTSTRGYGPVDFNQTVLDGLAPDGGLYLPQSYPQISAEQLENFSVLPYSEIAEIVMWPYVAEVMDVETFRNMIDHAYSQFRHHEITPVQKLLPDLYLLELFHGPTLAFKDIALQLLGQMIGWALQKHHHTATVIGATSGDTGPAALAALAGLPQVNAFILFPHNRTSAIQRRQMTTLHGKNIYPLAIEGTFDDCQHIVKRLFQDTSFNTQVGATAVNSISWARLMPQIVYYFYAYSRLNSKLHGKKPYFVVPTGNFGDIFAGYIAKRMGLPVEKLIIASNQNDILTRFITEQDYSRKDVLPSLSPSIDIQVASNFERLLYEALGRNTEALNTLMRTFAQTGRLPPLPADAFGYITAQFGAGKASENETLAALHEAYERYHQLICPHTAVALFVALQRVNMRPTCVLATAHPAKFPEAVQQATAVHPELPTALAPILEKEERFDVLAADIDAVKAYIQDHVSGNKTR